MHTLQEDINFLHDQLTVSEQDLRYEHMYIHTCINGGDMVLLYFGLSNLLIYTYRHWIIQCTKSQFQIFCIYHIHTSKIFEVVFVDFHGNLLKFLCNYLQVLTNAKVFFFKSLQYNKQIHMYIRIHTYAN